MPFFTLHRNYALQTTKGRSFNFVKGEPVWVTPECVPDAIAIGAIPEESVADVLGDESAPPVYLTPQEREAKLFAAFDLMIARDERGDFTASNMPHCKRLISIVGFEVYNTERDEAWQKYNQLKAESA